MTLMKSQVALAREPNGTQIAPCGYPEKYLLDYHKSSHLPLDNPAFRRQDRLAASR